MRLNRLQYSDLATSTVQYARQYISRGLQDPLTKISITFFQPDTDRFCKTYLLHSVIIQGLVSYLARNYLTSRYEVPRGNNKNG
jgi:hypothetical protein